MSKTYWKFVQENSDLILSDGLFKLKTSPVQMFRDIQNSDFGNYIISNNQENYYIGEGMDLKKRIYQQFKPATSTFYKNFIKLQKINQAIKPLPIDSFKVQTITTEIGRKEIEEFGIINLPTLLNRFQLDKRHSYKVEDKTGLWDKVQKLKAELIFQAEQEVLKCKFNSWFECNVEATPGLYMVRNKIDSIIYIGESSDICERFNTHTGTTYFSALRRHIGTDILGYNLQERKGKKRYFEDVEDKIVTDFLKSCNAIFYPIQFGRYELEEYLIKKYKPLLNRKNNTKDN